MLNMYVFNLITFTKLFSLLATFFNTQQTFQRCLNIFARRYVRQCQINFEIKKQRRIHVVYFNVDINNIRKRRKNVVILSVELQNVDQRWNNIKNLKRAKKYFWVSKKKMTQLINNICCRLWSIKKKGKNGTYNVKINVRKYNGIWKEYENNSMGMLMAK